MYYQNLFNNQYINLDYYTKLQEQQFQISQQKEIFNMIKALDDFISAANKIAPQYQEQALKECIMYICKRVYEDNNQ